MSRGAARSVRSFRINQLSRLGFRRFRIYQSLIIQQILGHLGLWDPEPVERGPPKDKNPADAPHWPAKAQLPLEYVPVPDIP